MLDNNVLLFERQNLPFIFGLLLLDLTLKGIALWKAARHGQRNWFIVLLVINTVGILPIIYLYFFQKKTKK